MPIDQPRRSMLSRYRSDLRNVVGSSASAYGYTLTVWSTGMVLSYAYGPPSPPLVVSFFLGAVLGFAVVGALAFGGVTVEFGGESRRVQLWGSFRFMSVGLAVGTAWFLSAHAPSLPGWPLGAFVATITYLVVVGAENTAADVSAD
jgi:hypothetical protein